MNSRQPSANFQHVLIRAGFVNEEATYVMYMRLEFGVLVALFVLVGLLGGGPGAQAGVSAPVAALVVEGQTSQKPVAGAESEQEEEDEEPDCE